MPMWSGLTQRLVIQTRKLRYDITHLGCRPGVLHALCWLCRWGCNSLCVCTMASGCELAQPVTVVIVIVMASHCWHSEVRSCHISMSRTSASKESSVG